MQNLVLNKTYGLNTRIPDMQFAATWMELVGIMLNEESKKKKDKHRISLRCGI